MLCLWDVVNSARSWKVLLIFYLCDDPSMTITSLECYLVQFCHVHIYNFMFAYELCSMHIYIMCYVLALVYIYIYKHFIHLLSCKLTIFLYIPFFFSGFQRILYGLVSNQLRLEPNMYCYISCILSMFMFIYTYLKWMYV